MPDLQQYQLTPLSNASLTVPRFQIECVVTDSQSGAVLFDFTGANAIVFPRDLLTLYPTAAERRAFADLIANELIRKKAGLS